MHVTINEQDVAVEIQNEQTAGEVMKALDLWLNSQGHTLIAVRVNGEQKDPRVGEWLSMPLASVDSLDIDAPSLSQLRRANLEILSEYAQTLHHALLDLSNGQNTLVTVKNLLASFAEVKPATIYLSASVLNPGINQGSDIGDDVERLVAASTRPDGSFNAGVLPELAGIVYSLVVLSKDRLKEIDDPIKEARTTGVILETLIGDLSMVSTKLLTGKGKEAFDTILRFSELMSKLLRLFWLMVETRLPGATPPFSREDLQSWTSAINSTLEQITEALDSQDTVLLGDILEYELPQHIESLVNLIPENSREA